MSLNMSYAMNPKKTRRFGKLFNTIDFVFNDELSTEMIKNLKSDTIIGEFQIGNKLYPVTLEEIIKIEETMANVKSVFLKSYKLGRYGV